MPKKMSNNYDDSYEAMGPSPKEQHKTNMEQGFIALGSPDKAPEGDPRKEDNQDGYTAPSSRLHGGDTGVFPFQYPIGRW